MAVRRKNQVLGWTCTSQGLKVQTICVTALVENFRTEHVLLSNHKKNSLEVSQNMLE